MYKYCGYDSFITAYPEIELPRMKDVPGMRVERVPKISGDWIEDSCVWLKDNAKRIDVLNLYHLCSRSLKHLLTYKLHNPQGKVYLKLDGVPLTRATDGLKIAKGICKYVKGAEYIIKRLICIMMAKAFTLVSTELYENADILTKRLKRKVICVPNPLNPNEIHEYRPFSERSDTILTVGRLGTKQKATEILLEAFARIANQIPKWTLKLVGSISENMNIADEFFAKYPDMKERVLFAGAIENREMLSEVYRDAKVFAFPSRWESFGIALTEAMMNGCFAVCSRIPSSTSLTENFRFALGHDVDDVDSLAENLLYACTHEAEIERLAIEGRNATLRRCDLKSVCEIIAEELKRT